MKENYRPGSMGAADAKNSKTAVIIIAAIFTAAFLLTIIPNKLYFHQYFLRAGLFFKLSGFISMAGWYIFLLFKARNIILEKGDKGSAALLLFGWAAATLLFFFGFDLGLMGIE